MELMEKLKAKITKPKAALNEEAENKKQLKVLNVFELVDCLN